RSAPFDDFPRCADLEQAGDLYRQLLAKDRRPDRPNHRSTDCGLHQAAARSLRQVHRALRRQELNNTKGRETMGRLDGRVAIVTGGAKGIGVHYVRALAAEGARLMIADIADGKEVAES